MLLIREKSDTHWGIFEEDVEVGKFRLIKMPYCSAICILCNVKIKEEHRGRGYGKAIVAHSIRESRKQNYSRLVATVVSDNFPMLSCIKNWETIDHMVNPKTGNIVYVKSFNLSQTLLAKFWRKHFGDGV